MGGLADLGGNTSESNRIDFIVRNINYRNWKQLLLTKNKRMVYLSKPFIQSVICNCECREIIHPWNSSCFHATMDMIISSLKGCGIFFLVMHLLQNIAKLRHKKRINLRHLTINILRSLCFGVTYASSFVFLNCLFRSMLGKINYNIMFYTIPFCNGLPIFLDSPQRRDTVATTFISMAFECLYKTLAKRNAIVRSKKIETALFMIINAMLMYSLKINQEVYGEKDSAWFLEPTGCKCREPQENADISQPSLPIECIYNSNIIKDTLKCGLIGLALSGVRFLLFKLMSPLKNKEIFLQWKNMQPAIFMGLYALIYKAVSNYLHLRESKDSLDQTFLSGLLAGASYWFSPSLTILFTALTLLLKIKGRQIKKKYKVPNLPYTEFYFILCNMFLMQKIALDNETVPRLFKNILSFCTTKKAPMAIEAIWKVLQI